jgi:hypothetical protein
MTEVELTHWNDFLEAYGGVNASKGTFSVATEMLVEQGKLQGYIKPVLKNLEVARSKESKESPLKVIWETIVAGIAELLTNQPKDQIATRIPLSGDIVNPSPDIFATIGELLRNAYIEALFPSLEGYVGRSVPANQGITQKIETPI